LSDIPLNLQPTEALLKELFIRYDAFIFSGIKTLSKFEDNQESFFHGGKFTCLGLADALANNLLNDIADGTTEGNEDE